MDSEKFNEEIVKLVYLAQNTAYNQAIDDVKLSVQGSKHHGCVCPRCRTIDVVLEMVEALRK